MRMNKFIKDNAVHKTMAFENKCPCGKIVTLRQFVEVEEGLGVTEAGIDDENWHDMGFCSCGNVFLSNKTPIN